MHSYLKGLEMFGNFSQSPHPTKGRCCGSSFFSQRACWYVAGVHSLSSYFCINHSILLIDNCIYEDHGTIDDSATYSPTACTPHPRTSRPSPSPPWWMPMPRRGRLMKRGPDWKRWSRKWLPTSRWDGRWPWMGDESQREPCRKAWGSNDEPPRNLIDLGWFVRKILVSVVHVEVGVRTTIWSIASHAIPRWPILESWMKVDPRACFGGVSHPVAYCLFTGDHFGCRP